MAGGLGVESGDWARMTQSPHNPQFHQCLQYSVDSRSRQSGDPTLGGLVNHIRRRVIVSLENVPEDLTALDGQRKPRSSTARLELPEPFVNLITFHGRLNGSNYQLVPTSWCLAKFSTRGRSVKYAVGWGVFSPLANASAIRGVFDGSRNGLSPGGGSYTLWNARTGAAGGRVFSDRPAIAAC